MWNSIYLLASKYSDKFSSNGTTALLNILATPFAGFLPIIGFSVYLQIGAS